MDELNTFVGKLKFLCIENKKEEFQKLATELGKIQNDLFNAGTVLATLITDESMVWASTLCITESSIKELEDSIDAMNKPLETLKSFTLPGTDAINAEAHICRTVCRRTERILCEAKDNGVAVSDSVMAYINRLSDYFFVVSRFASFLSEAKEAQWLQGKASADL